MDDLHYFVIFRPTGGPGPPPEQRLRAVLKYAGRVGLRCVRLRERRPLSPHPSIPPATEGSHDGRRLDQG
jgi:hypothetical protein